MESVHLIAEEWSSLSGQYTTEESDFMSEFLAGNSNYSVCGNGNTNFGMPTSLWPTHESTILTVTETNTNGTYSFDHATNIDSLSMLFCLGDTFQCDQNLSIQINDCIDEGSGLEPVKLVLADNNNLQAKREHEIMVSEENLTKNIENPAKRLRSSIEVSKNMRNVRKCKKSDYVNNEEDLQWNGSSNCFSQVDSNVYVELNGGTCNSSLIPKEPQAPNLCKKSRATSGPATDAQSIYARRRRERINERLKILQTLVPNGTKVDISTMLEEAVEYVKFLQLQIKLLSSDDMWMYAPIAYNGMNIGLDLNYTSSTKGRS